MNHLFKQLSAIPLTLIFLVSATSGIFAQAGTIHWENGSESRIDSFSEVSIRLVYHWWNRPSAKSEQREYFRSFPVPDMKEIVFMKQKGRGSAGFYYKVKISGYDEKGNLVEETIPTWDWIEMKILAGESPGKSRITFFHNKRKVSIDRIDFDE